MSDPTLTERALYHAVYFYPSIDDLTRTVTRYVAEGFAEHQPTFVVARRQLRRDVMSALEGLGLDAVAAEREARLFLIDADDTLELLRVDGRFDPQRARQRINDLFNQLPEPSRTGPVRVFGEMCGMLWHSGNYLDALQLEDLDGIWNTRRGLTTLCSYSLEQPERSAQDAICTFHTHRLSADGQLEVIR